MLQAGQKQSRPHTVALGQHWRRYRSQGADRHELDAYLGGGDEYSECRDPEGKRRLQEGGCPCGADAGEIEPEPGRRARLVHQVLDTRRCPFAQQLTVAFKPGQKGDDLVEFGEAEAGEPAEGKEKCDGANSSIDLPAERYGQQQERGEPKTAQRDRCHARIELNLLPLTGSIESNDIMTIES